MGASTYRLRGGGTSLTHVTHTRAGRLRFLSDLSDQPTDLEVEALVASGDCFITLATALDHLSETLEQEDHLTRPQLEKLTALLLHLQRHYTIARKHPSYRQ